MKALKEVLAQLIKAPGYRERLKAWGVLLDWEKVVGEEAAARCWPVSFAHGRLTLGVVDHLWASALRFEVPRILSVLNQSAGEDLFREIRFSVGHPPRRKPREKRLPTLTPKEVQRLEEEVASIEDPELREAFKGWRRVLLQAQKRIERELPNRPHPDSRK